jgi:hypothetical protein
MRKTRMALLFSVMLSGTCTFPAALALTFILDWFYVWIDPRFLLYWANLSLAAVFLLGAFAWFMAASPHRPTE